MLTIEYFTYLVIFGVVLGRFAKFRSQRFAHLQYNSTRLAALPNGHRDSSQVSQKFQHFCSLLDYSLPWCKRPFVPKIAAFAQLSAREMPCRNFAESKIWAKVFFGADCDQPPVTNYAPVSPLGWNACARTMKTWDQSLVHTGFLLGLNDRAQHPVVLVSALSFFLSALSFFQCPVIFREPFGFFGLSSALFWAWSCRKHPIRQKVARFLCITFLFASDIAAILDLRLILINTN